MAAITPTSVIGPTSVQLNHPSYLTRQLLTLVGAAGANGVNDTFYTPFGMRLRTGYATVKTAGTATGCMAIVMVGTATAGSVVMSTSTATDTAHSTGDMNYYVPANSYIGLKNGTDATGVQKMAIEWYHDPVNSQWTPG